MTQITTFTLTGRFGKKIKKFSTNLINAHLIHTIASDAHNVLGIHFHTREASEFIAIQYGMDTLYTFYENAEAIINCYACFKDTPEKIKKKKFLGIFKR